MRFFNACQGFIISALLRLSRPFSNYNKAGTNVVFRKYPIQMLSMGTVVSRKGGCVFPV